MNYMSQPQASFRQQCIDGWQAVTCLMKGVAGNGRGAFAGARVPHTQSCITSAAPSDDGAAVRGKCAARHRAAVPCKHLLPAATEYEKYRLNMTGELKNLQKRNSVTFTACSLLRVGRGHHWPAHACGVCMCLTRASHQTTSTKSLQRDPALLSAGCGDARTCMQAAVSAFHIQVVKSSDPASRTPPRGCHCSHVTPSSGPSSVCSRAPVAASHTLTRPAVHSRPSLSLSAQP